MATWTIYASTADGDVYSSGTAAQARSGTGLTLLSGNSATYFSFGQEYASFVYYVYEAFIQFDTASVTGTVQSATLDLYISNDQSATDFTMKAAVYDWGTAVETTDFRSSTQLAALSGLRASLSTSGITANAYNAFTSDASFKDNAAGGTVKLALFSDRVASAIDPTGKEYVGCNSGNGANPPRLTIVTLDTYTKTFTADAIVAAAAGTTQTKTFTADAIVKATGTKTFTADAIVTLKRGAPRAGLSLGGQTPTTIAESGSPVTIQTGDVQNAPTGWAIASDGTYVAAYSPSVSHSGSGSVVVKRSTDAGATWGSTIPIATQDATYYYGFGGIGRTSTGDLILSYNRATLPSGTDYEVRFKISTDNGATWGSEIAAATGATFEICASPVIEIPDGSGYLLQAIGTYTSVWGWKIMRSTDRGATWSAFSTPSVGQTGEYGEPHLANVRLANGTNRILASLVYLGTTNDIRTTYSDDGGTTWATMATALSNATASPAILQLHDGSIVMHYRNLSASENNYWTRSIDYGVTWGTAGSGTGTLLDNGGRMRYGQWQRVSGPVDSALDVDTYAIVYAWETPVVESTSAGIYFQLFTSSPVVLELIKTFTADAVVAARNTQTFTADAMVSNSFVTQNTRTFTADAVVQGQGLTKAFTADAIVSATVSGSGTFTKTFTVDAHITSDPGASFTTGLFFYSNVGQILEFWGQD